MDQTQIAEMDTRLQAVINLANRELQADPTESREHYQRIVEVFESLRKSLADGSLAERFGTGAGFGATRAIGEWGLNGSELYDKAFAAEEYFRRGE